MAYKKLITLDAEKVYALGGVDKKTGTKNPIQIEGYYLGKVEQKPNRYTKPGKVDYIYYFQTPRGNEGIYSKTHIDKVMKSATLGHMTKLTWVRMTDTPNGPMHTYELRGDDENTIDVSGLSQQVAASSVDEDEYETETNEDETEVDDEPVRNAAPTLSAAEKKAKVDALLNRKGNKVS